jgi:hypothetical protein
MVSTFNYFIHAVADARELDIHEPRSDLAVGFNHIDQLNGMIVTIAQKNLRLVAQER